MNLFYLLLCLIIVVIIIVILFICWKPKKELKPDHQLLNEFGISDEEIAKLGHEALVLQDLIQQKLVDKPEVDQLKRSFLDKLYNLETLKEDVINIKVEKQKGE